MVRARSQSDTRGVSATLPHVETHHEAPALPRVSHGRHRPARRSLRGRRRGWIPLFSFHHSRYFAVKTSFDDASTRTVHVTNLTPGSV
jgi:hypothetical protein